MMKINSLNMEQLARFFDHSLLRPDCVNEEFDQLVDQVIKYGFRSAAVNSSRVTYVLEELRKRGSDIPVGSSAGFPFGQASIISKVAEARQALKEGASEIDYMINVGRLLDGNHAYVLDEMRQMTKCCHDQGAICKVIFENSYLEPKHIKAACKIALETDIDFLKTTTGFGPGGATVHDVKLMREVVGDKKKLKPAGAMRTVANVAAMLEIEGVERIGSAFSHVIMEEFRSFKDKGIEISVQAEGVKP